ncbi:sensor histidine kinase [Ruminococcus sp. KGMB03662]|nr:sensor histidine kinase [Ruminococcus sp. KGMB03662]
MILLWTVIQGLRPQRLIKKQHGLGTSIIREIARKYNGRCDFYESEGMFCCQVTLMADTTVLN